MTIKVYGFKEVQRKLIEIGSVTGTKIMRSSMFTATRPLHDKAKQTAPRRSGALAESIGRTFGVKSGSGILSGDGDGSRFSILVGPKVRNRTAVALYNLVYKLKRARRGIFHGHLVEFGTVTGTRATNWLKTALLATSTTCTRLLAITTKTRIDQICRKP